MGGLSSLRQHAHGDLAHVLGLDRLAACGRHIDIVDRERLALEHARASLAHAAVSAGMNTTLLNAGRSALSAWQGTLPRLQQGCAGSTSAASIWLPVEPETHCPDRVEALCCMWRRQGIPSYSLRSANWGI
jgi:hypothetical protein